MHRRCIPSDVEILDGVNNARFGVCDGCGNQGTVFWVLGSEKEYSVRKGGALFVGHLDEDEVRAVGRDGDKYRDVRGKEKALRKKGAVAKIDGLTEDGTDVSMDDGTPWATGDAEIRHLRGVAESIPVHVDVVNEQEEVVATMDAEIPVSVDEVGVVHADTNETMSEIEKLQARIKELEAAEKEE